MALATAAQVAGFISFSESLLFSTLKIAFLVAGVFLFLQINSMVIMLLEHSLIANMAFISRYGKELGARLETILKMAIWGMAFFSLLPVFGFYSSANQAFQMLFLSQVTIGNLSLSPMLVLLAFLVLYLSSFISWILRGVLESEVFPRMQVERGAGQSITKLMHYFLILFGFLIGLSVIGIDLKSFAVMGGALGIGIGFGLQNIVNNFLSGLILLFERPVRVGDRIDAGGQLGIVKKIGLRSTVVETLDQAELIIPNSQLVSEKVTNWTHSGTVARLKIPVGVAYGSDMDLVFDTLIAAALTSPHVLTKPKPLALLLGFGESSLNVELHVWLFDVNETRRAQSEISREILRRFGEAGIEIPFPQQEVRMQYKESAPPVALMPQTK
jgi:small-conductance mechanosensitive channel